MPKYKVSINCIENYQELEIEAENEWEAEEKYQAMLEAGDVPVVNSHFIDLKVNKASREISALFPVRVSTQSGLKRGMQSTLQTYG